MSKVSKDVQNSKGIKTLESLKIMKKHQKDENRENLIEIKFFLKQINMKKGKLRENMAAQNMKKKCFCDSL